MEILPFLVRQDNKLKKQLHKIDKLYIIKVNIPNEFVLGIFLLVGFLTTPCGVRTFCYLIKI